MFSKHLLFVFLCLGLFLISFQSVYAADGSGTCTLSPSQVIENTDTTLTFTFTAGETMDGGAITIQIPSGWSAPQGTSGTAGYTVGSSTGTIGALTFSGQTITVPITALANTQTITVVYGSGGGTSSARVQSISGRGGTVSFTVSSKSSAGGTLTAISSSPTIQVVDYPEPDGTPPVSKLTTPVNGEVITTSSYTIEGTAEDSGGTTPAGVAWVKVGINPSTSSGQATWLETTSVGQGFSIWKYEWQDIAEGSYVIQTKSADWQGNNETPGEGVTVTVSFETEEEEIEEEEVVEEEPTPTSPEPEEEAVEEEEVEEKPISEMTAAELREKIKEIQLQIIELLTQLVQLIKEQIAELST